MMRFRARRNLVNFGHAGSEQLTAARRTCFAVTGYIRFGKNGCFDLAEITMVAMPKRNLRVAK
jgi:hypothetical protein